jgi:hypothetical protein
MSQIPDDLLYTEEHEYLKPTGEDGVYLVGVTDYAQGELGDVVFLELPAEGDTLHPNGCVRDHRGGEGGERPLRARHRRGGGGEPALDDDPRW